MGLIQRLRHIILGEDVPENWEQWCERIARDESKRYKWSYTDIVGIMQTMHDTGTYGLDDDLIVALIPYVLYRADRDGLTPLGALHRLAHEIPELF
ncbi:MAG: hypothetical protein ACXQS4_05160 [Methermicoccaceae archaeon]